MCALPGSPAMRSHCWIGRAVASGSYERQLFYPSLSLFTSSTGSTPSILFAQVPLLGVGLRIVMSRCYVLEHKLSVLGSKLERMKSELPPNERGLIDGLVEARRDVIQLHVSQLASVAVENQLHSSIDCFCRTRMQYMKVMPTLFLKYPELFHPKEFSYERFAWAVSIIMSRTWGRQISDPILNKRQGQAQRRTAK